MSAYTSSASSTVREWILAGIVVLGFAGDIASRYVGGYSQSLVTASQVTRLSDQVATLTTQISALNSQIGASPRVSDVLANTARLDKHDAAISMLQSDVAGVRADVNNLMHPFTYRNPRN